MKRETELELVKRKYFDNINNFPNTPIKINNRYTIVSYKEIKFVYVLSHSKKSYKIFFNYDNKICIGKISDHYLQRFNERIQTNFFILTSSFIYELLNQYFEEGKVCFKEYTIYWNRSKVNKNIQLMTVWKNYIYC